ncbi:phosphoglycolate phosphatase [Loktanella fryxellensis]|uniref:Phosphoglycolate phosphatase n=1 Tax=Loktanella fryxellensis TaxID=245187 RepID=A0A1H8ARM4_9RHOB|nr:phosphoglycolate phosphatase [Loktanella fryxellensis]SEM73372.1 phosphoglycolate phosphatase [Loktanella fryxellensis]
MPVHDARPGGIVFDLDGTLIDSAPDIHAAVNRMLAGIGAAPLDMPTVVSFIGHGLPHLVGLVRAHHGIDAGEQPRMLAAMMTQYAAHPVALTRPYPGVVAALTRLQAAGHPLGLCTNKPVAATHAILDALDLSRFFAAVIGGDSLPVRKPDPAPLHAAFAALPAARLVYVGDSEVDAQTSHAAQVPFALFTRGYRKSPVADLAHVVAFDDFADLPAHVADLQHALTQC